MARFHSAEIVKSETGMQYHIGLKPGEVAPYVLLCGDPARAKRVSKMFDSVRVERANREYLTFTGKYNGIPLSIMATGMGPDNTEIAVIELSQVVKSPTLIRIGSCGALKKGIGLGDLVISSAAVRLENTTSFFVCDGYPAVAHHEVIVALQKSAKKQELPSHIGITATAPGFYGAQARKVPGFMPRFPDLPKQLESMNVSNFEMETSALFVLATLGGFRAGSVCAVYANRHKNVFIDTRTKEMAELRCIKCGLGAVEILAGNLT
jgi:uridine phosphorylase